MFDIGFQELTLIGVIALIVVGPERLPKMARTLGLWTGKIRYYVNQVKNDIDREVRAQELKEMLDKPARELDALQKVAEETKGTLDQAKDALGEAKSAFESAPAGVSTPNEPAAGSIFPTELPEVGAEAAQSGPPRPPPEAGSTETDPTDAAPAEIGPPEAPSPGAPSPETSSPGTSTDVKSGGRDDAPAAATDAGENDERPIGRL